MRARASHRVAAIAATTIARVATRVLPSFPGRPERRRRNPTRACDRSPPRPSIARSIARSPRSLDRPIDPPRRPRRSRAFADVLPLPLRLLRDPSARPFPRRGYDDLRGRRRRRRRRGRRRRRARGRGRRRRADRRAARGRRRGRPRGSHDDAVHDEVRARAHPGDARAADFDERAGVGAARGRDGSAGDRGEGAEGERGCRSWCGGTCRTGATRIGGSTS